MAGPNNKGYGNGKYGRFGYGNGIVAPGITPAHLRTIVISHNPPKLLTIPIRTKWSPK